MMVEPIQVPNAEQKGLADRLPQVRGSYAAQVDLSNMTWFRAGGPAEVLFRPADEADLLGFLQHCPADVPVTVIGVGSNLLVRDGGVRGVVIRLGKDFSSVAFDGETVRVGAGTPSVQLALAAADAGIAGLEFFRGIPGTVGGALRMNAGAYGGEIADVLASAVAVDRAGRRHDVTAAQLGYSYRHSGAPADWIFTSAVLRGRRGDPAAIHQRISEISTAREATQPIKTSTGGSTFKNPPGQKAWELIDKAGCRGLVHGRARVSPMHCNFLENLGGATADDLEQLGEDVRRRVREKTGVALDWEIRIIGEPGGAA